MENETSPRKKGNNGIQCHGNNIGVHGAFSGTRQNIIIIKLIK